MSPAGWSKCCRLSEHLPESIAYCILAGIQETNMYIERYIGDCGI